MSQLILVKHSLPELDPQKPAAEWHLSEVGRRRCTALAARLAPYAPARIFSSREPKAMETAQLVAAQLNLPAEAADDLHEHDRRNVGWMERGRLETAVAQFFGEPGQLVMGLETADAAHARFARAVNALLRSHPAQTVVIVAHGTVITLFVARLLSLEPFAFWKRLGLPSFVVLEGTKLLTVVESVESG